MFNALMFRGSLEGSNNKIKTNEATGLWIQRYGVL
jgi:hypothetical protein